MSKLLVSKIFEEKSVLNSKSYTSLSPSMKEAVDDLLRMIKSEGNLIFNVENAVEKIASQYDVDKKELHNYIEQETNEQLGL